MQLNETVSKNNKTLNDFDRQPCVKERDSLKLLSFAPFCLMYHDFLHKKEE